MGNSPLRQPNSENAGCKWIGVGYRTTTSMPRPRRCSDNASRLGWFVSYADQAHPKIVLVVLVRGHSSAIKGAMAAGVAGRMYRRLNDENYFATLNNDPRTSVIAVGTRQ